MTKPRKKCTRCYGYVKAHSPFCSYLRGHRIVDVAVHEKGMILTYGNGTGTLWTWCRRWVNLAYAKQLGYDI